MSNEEVDVKLQLEKVLRKFSVENLREHAAFELEVGTWARALKMMHKANASVTVANCSIAMVNVQKKTPNSECIANLRLKAIGLSSSKTWEVFQLINLTAPRDLTPPEIARSVGSTLKKQVRVTRGLNGFLLLGIGAGVRMSVAAFNRQTASLMVAFKPELYLEGITTGLGYEQVKNCHLSGRHIPSLLRMLEARKGGRSLLNTIASENKENAPILPNRTPLGLDFSKSKKIGERVDEKIGVDPPKLQSLTVNSEVPVQGRSFPLRTSVTLSSADVMASLSDMAHFGLISDDNVFFKMIDKGRSDITIKFES